VLGVPPVVLPGAPVASVRCATTRSERAPAAAAARAHAAGCGAAGRDAMARSARAAQRDHAIAVVPLLLDPGTQRRRRRMTPPAAPLLRWRVDRHFRRTCPPFFPLRAVAMAATLSLGGLTLGAAPLGWALGCTDGLRVRAAAALFLAGRRPNPCECHAG
jgi:hypothetical protein